MHKSDIYNIQRLYPIRSRRNCSDYQRVVYSFITYNNVYNNALNKTGSNRIEIFPFSIIMKL
jgi:hypothetical protein